ncbi:MAG: hypothetical protein U0L18_01645 [Acutalibacteraceae bacterium]|nr:hypothetical protein [Acutalibacteraceae bacterium]
MNCYAIWFESIITSGTINAGRGYYKTILEAISKSEGNPAFIKWLK